MNDPIELKPPRRVPGLLFAVAGAALLLTQLGYSFERGDQLQYLLLPYRMIYPDFLPLDWFTWHTTQYHHAFAWIVVGLHWVFGEDNFAAAMLGSHVVVLIALGYALWRLSRAWGFGTLHASVAIVLLACVRETGLGGHTLNHGQLLPADMAWPPFLLACANWLERRSLRAGAWLGLSGLLHANFAVLGPLVLLPAQAFLCLREKRPRELLVFSIAYAVLAVPVLILIVRDFLLADAAPAAVFHMLQVRAPHHYELSTFPPQDFWWVGLLWVAGLPGWLSGRAWCGGDRNRWLLGSMLGVLGLGLIGALFEIPVVMRLYVWRISIALIIVLLLVFTHTVVCFARARHPAGLIWSLACLCAIAAFARDDLAQLTPPPFQNGWFALPALVPLCLVGLALARGIPAPSAHQDTPVEVPAHGRIRSWLLLGMAAPVWWGVNALSQPLPAAVDGEELSVMRGPRLGSFWLQPRRRGLYERVRQVTPRRASFLIPPSLLGFRLQARRAVYVDWKCAPMRGVEAREWERRMLAVLGTREFPHRGYDLRVWSEARYAERSLQALGDLARHERLDFVIFDRQPPPPASAGLEAYFAVRHFRVYRVLSAAEMGSLPRRDGRSFP